MYGVSEPISAFWALPDEQLLSQLESSPTGLTTQAAQDRLAQSGGRLERRKHSPWKLLAAQFNSPIILLLLVSSILSFALGDQTNAGIILVILVASGLLSFFQEWSAADAVERLLAVIQTEATVLRDGEPKSI